MTDLSNVNDSEPVAPSARRVHDSNYVLNELKSVFLSAEGLFGDLATEELGIVWEHEFYPVDDTAGNGISDKFFEYSAGVVRSGADVRVPEGEWIRTKERGDYGAGKTAVPGVGVRWSQAPTGDQDGWVGYYSETNGIGAGVGYKVFSDGESGATSAGAQPYVFYEVGGEGREVVPQEHWNISPLDGSDSYPAFDPTDGTLIRLPHAAYGHGRLEVQIGIKRDDASADFGSADDAFAMYPAHVFTKPGETMWDDFDLPIEWNTTGTQANGFEVLATACHYQGDLGRGVKRIAGEGFTPQKNGGSVITLNAYPDWTYLLSYRKRSGWESVDITPTGFAINATQNIEVQLTVGGEFANTSYDIPDDTGTTETAVEYDLKTYDLAADAEKTTDTTITSDGRREWYGIVAGDKQEPFQVSADLDNVVLASQEPLALLARPATGTSTDINFAVLRNGGSF